MIETKVAWLVDLNYNFEFDWFVELSDNKLSDNKLSDNNLAGKVEKTDPRSADYPLTPLRGLPYGLLYGLPSTDYPK